MCDISIGKAAAISPHDTNPLAGGMTDAIYVGGAGNLNVTLQDGTTILFSGLLAGTVYRIRATHVLNTSTSATLLRAIYST